MESGLLLRVNGVLPAKSSTGACTSCSIVVGEGDNATGSGSFNLLVDAGPGVKTSISQAASELHLHKSSPDAILITHAHREQYEELESILALSEGTKIYCTKECADQITKDYPSLAQRISHISPTQAFDVGPLSIVAVAADHTSESGGPAGSVIYVVRYQNKKIICGWDFLSLPNADANLLWNPDLLVIGADTYNDHPSTGLVSVSEAYNLVRRWNAKDTFVVRYSGQKDSEDARNQWFRGPTRPLLRDELQNVINEHLRVSGAEGKYSITAAKQGDVWRPHVVDTDIADEPVGDSIELEATEKYVLKLLKNENKALVVTIEDSINRQEIEFSNARVSNEGRQLDAEPIKGFMMKGPELSMTISLDGDESTVKVNIVKGKKAIISDNMRFSKRDAQRLIRYINHNFASGQKISTSV